MKTQLGNLYDIVQEHDLLADAVQTSLTSGGLVQGNLSDLRIEMDSFSKDIRVFAESAKVSSETVLSINSRIREKANSRHQAMRSRLKMLEAVLDDARRPPSPLPTQRTSPANMMYGGANHLSPRIAASLLLLYHAFGGVPTTNRRSRAQKLFK